MISDLGIPEHAFKVLFAGKLVPRKMPETLIEAVISLNEAPGEEPIHLILAGEGPLRKQLEKRFAHHSFIHFMGFRNQRDMPAVYRIGDVFVLPSSIETWGLAVNEAFACSRPAIVSDRVGCAPDLVVDGVTGFSFTCGDSEDLAEKIHMLRRDRERCRGMGENAFKRIENWSTVKAAGKMTEFILEKSAEYHSSRSC